MKNIALIFAGGTGSRMINTEKPKQFLELDEKPIIVHTIEKFQKCDLIDAISVTVLEDYIHYMNELKVKYNLDKIKWIVAGGKTGQESIYNSLKSIKSDESVDDEALVLIHDGVRPIIDESLILENIAKARTVGSAITVVKATETSLKSINHTEISEILDRSILYNARAPQTFFLNDIIAVHEKEIEKKIFDNIDSCSMMYKYNYPINFVVGKSSNIKITTYEDFYIFKALYELDVKRKDNEQLK